MICLKARITEEKWFSDRCSKWDIFRFTVYNQITSKNVGFGFIRKPKFTILIDLSIDEKEIFSGFAHQTRSQINKSKNLHLHFEETNIDEFESFYNEFAQKKGLNKLDRSILSKYDKLFVYTKVSLGNRVLAMHAYLCDSMSKRIRCQYSASIRLDSEDKDLLKTIGIANRALHWEDMRYFKKLGFTTYDFAGFCTDPSNHSLLNVNQFKKGFSKNIVQEDILYSLPAFFLEKIRISIFG